MRERPYDAWMDKKFEFISIHAPLRERPLRQAFMLQRYYDFNPRSLAGATARFETQSSRLMQFQFTLPCGSDDDNYAYCPYCGNFNPRSLAGATMENFQRCKQAEISIHAPLRERQSASGSDLHTDGRFQSTLPRGSDGTG